MPLPAVDPYPMPADADLPANRVGWTADPRRAVLLVHDMQEHFLRIYPTGTSPLRELLANTAALRAAAVRHGVPVVYSAQPPDVARSERGLLWDFWGPGLRAGGEHIVSALAPAPGDTIVTKHRYSAFFRTGLGDLLRDAGRDQLVICGVYAHIGINASACDAFMADVETFVVADAVADFSAAEHLAALHNAASQFAVVTTTERLLAAWARKAETALSAQP